MAALSSDKDQIGIPLPENARAPVDLTGLWAVSDILPAFKEVTTSCKGDGSVHS